MLAVLFDDLDVPQASCGKTLKVKLKGVEEEVCQTLFVCIIVGCFMWHVGPLL